MFGFKKPSEDVEELDPSPAVPIPPRPAPSVTPPPAPAAVAPPKAPPAPVAARTAAPVPTPSARGTHIAADAEVHGSIRSAAGLDIAGEVNGNVHAQATVVIDTSACILGDVCGDDVIVRGRVEGQIVAKGKLTISTTGLVLGDIVVRSLLIEDGGTLQGQCRMGANASDAPANANAPQNPPAPPSEAMTVSDDDESIEVFVPDVSAAER
ncbi:MAG: polymer-forming cytoskeletal protein [Myxococcales bacterium FL481]|nr:MAG: polymer-forming cytoskeletal protein [Myxococcales bacterium FL481]